MLMEQTEGRGLWRGKGGARRREAARRRGMRKKQKIEKEGVKNRMKICRREKNKEGRDLSGENKVSGKS